jgi:uncharacterized BrkB/YihY/UPF0761 family membrane protein
MSGLITALNIAYEEPEKRVLFKLNLVAVGLTVAGIIVVAFVAVLPTAVKVLLAYRWTGRR